LIKTLFMASEEVKDDGAEPTAELSGGIFEEEVLHANHLWKIGLEYAHVVPSLAAHFISKLRSEPRRDENHYNNANTMEGEQGALSADMQGEQGLNLSEKKVKRMKAHWQRKKELAKEMRRLICLYCGSPFIFGFNCKVRCAPLKKMPIKNNKEKKAKEIVIRLKLDHKPAGRAIRRNLVTYHCQVCCKKTEFYGSLKADLRELKLQRYPNRLAKLRQLKRAKKALRIAQLKKKKQESFSFSSFLGKTQSKITKSAVIIKQEQEKEKGNEILRKILKPQAQPQPSLSTPIGAKKGQKESALKKMLRLEEEKRQQTTSLSIEDFLKTLK